MHSLLQNLNSIIRSFLTKPKLSLTFLLLVSFGLGSFLAWGLSASFLMLAPFASLIHRCKKMLSGPDLFLGLGIVIFFVLLIWLILMCVTAYYQKKSSDNYLNNLSFSPDWPEKLKLAADLAKTTIPIYYVHTLDHLAFAYGLINPRIIVSRSIVENLDLDELIAVLLHEESHGLRKDPLSIFVIRTLFSGLRRVRLFDRLIEHFLLAMEITADNYALTRLGDKSWSLPSALLKLVEVPNVMPINVTGAITGLDGRIDHLLNSEWRPQLLLSRFERLFLVLYLCLTVGTVYYSLQHLTVWFSCHTYSFFS